MALIIILVKAGLSLNMSDLKKVGRPSILMSFIPALSEMCIVGLIAPLLFPDLSYVESFLLGSVLGAVSPAVVIPMMGKLLDEDIGTKKGIPQLIIASSSIDDIIMIVFFQAFLSLEKGGSISFFTFLNIPISILSGICIGVLLGFLISYLFKKININETLKLIIIFTISFGLTFVEEILSYYFSYSSLLSIITMCIFIKKYHPDLSKNLVISCNKIWVIAEMFLFTLVGSIINIEYAFKYLVLGILLIVISLLFRSIAVSCCLIKTPLNKKERTFTILSYLPKATVQAALGGILLDYGNSINNEAIILSGTIVLSISIIAILISAPLGAISMNLTYKKLLDND
jgi:solute carrier family 9B (sodium/hydrogen exchanger), member 1/2